MMNATNTVTGPVDPQHGAKRFTRFFLKLFLGFVAGLGMLVIGATLFGHAPFLIDAVETMRGPGKNFMLAWRVIAYAMFVYFWPQICRWGQRRYGIRDHELQALQGVRGEIAVLAIVVEFGINQNGLARLLSWLVSY